MRRNINPTELSLKALFFRRRRDSLECISTFVDMKRHGRFKAEVKKNQTIQTALEVRVPQLTGSQVRLVGVDGMVSTSLKHLRTQIRPYDSDPLLNGDEIGVRSTFLERRFGYISIVLNVSPNLYESLFHQGKLG